MTSADREIAARDALAAVKQRIERWRYQTEHCPACGHSRHLSDCVVVEIVTLIDRALEPRP